MHPSYGVAIAVGSSSDIALEGNVICDNVGAGISISGRGGLVSVSNCTVAGNGGNAVVVDVESGQVRLRNNILWASGSGNACINVAAYFGAWLPFVQSSDFNDLYAGDGALVGQAGGARTNLVDWQTVTGFDAHSLSADPLFVDAVTGDYHLQSTEGSWHAGSWSADASNSPCIDAGSDLDPVGDEPAPHGQRINLGAHGGTVQASKSRPSRQLTLGTPYGGEVWWHSGTVTWRAWGDGAWSTNDTVDLLCSPDGGTNWAPIAGATGLSALSGRFEWDLDGVVSSATYRLRIEDGTNPGIHDESATNFTVISGGYYVNDATTDGDVYCTAAGQSANDGQTPATPLDSLQAVFDAYDIEGGDTVFLDSGDYQIGANIIVPPGDGGTVDAHVRIVGVPHRTVLLRGAPEEAGSCCIAVRGSYVSVEGLDLRGAERGLLVELYGIGTAAQACHVLNCRFSGNGKYAIHVEPLAYDALLSGNIILHEGSGAAVNLESHVAMAPRLPCRFVGNTVVAVKGLNIASESGPSVSNNIIVASGTNGWCLQTYYYWGHESDYNNYLARDGALVVAHDGGRRYSQGRECTTLQEWISFSGHDTHSLSVDPAFADEENGDLHLMSVAGRWDPASNGGLGGWTNDAVSSPCVDNGDPTADASMETSPSGGRVNLGAYGNSAQASRSPSRDLVLTSVGRDAVLRSFEPIRWIPLGTNWSNGETVHLDYSADSGGSWSSIPEATGLTHDTGIYWWDSRSVANGTQYCFRVTSDASPEASDLAEGVYRVDNNLSSPTLSWVDEPGYVTNGVDPDVGTANTSFVFRVTYADGDNHAPQEDYPRVHVLKDGVELADSPFAMTPVESGDSDYTDGAVHTFVRSGLAPGDDYTYWFEAVDSRGAPASGHPLTARSGPLVLRTYALAVESTFDVVSPPVGVHAYPAAGVSCVVTSAVLYEGSLATQYVCTGWAGSGSLTNGSGTNAAFVLTGDAVIRWLWATNYWLAVTTEGSGTTDRASGWYADASNVTFTALPVAHSHFSGWAGDTNGCAIDGARITVPVDSPRQITAEFAVDMHTVAVQSAHGHTVLERTTPTRLDIGFPGYDRSEVLNDFPVLISLGTNISGFGYDQFKSPAGEDLRFLDAAGALELAYEIENWDTGGVSHVWVQIPSLSSDTRILATWGVRSLAAPAYTTNGAAWSNGYAAVWHLNEDAGEHVDSTIRRNDVGPSGTMNQGASGMVAGGDEFNGASGVCRGVPFPGELTNTFTMALWAKPRAGHQIEPEMTGLMYGAVGQRYALYPCHGAVDYGSSSHAGAGVSLGINGVSVYEQSTSHFPPLLVWAGDVTNWSHVAVVFTNGQPTLYVNGALARTGLASRKVVHPSYAIGADSHGYYDGLLDDVRISDGVRSSNWLWACWMTVASNRPFTAYGNVTGMDGPSYPYGTELRSAVIDSPVSLGTTQVVCTGWIASGSTTNGSGTNVTFVLTEDTDIEWLWATNYWLSATPGPNGHVLAGSRWERAGTIANVEAVPSNYYHFVEWTGTVTSADNPLDVFMTQPHTIVAVFGENLATNGTPEWWLAAHGLTNREWNIEAMMDIDGDGMVAWEEFVADTDPTNRLSCLAIVNIKPVAGGFEVTWRGGEAGKQYLESRLGLLSTSRQWSAVFTNVPPTPVTTSTMHATTNRVLFYRIKAERP